MTVKSERVEARFPADLKRLAERAAVVSGVTLTDYLVNLVRNDAPKRLKAQAEMDLANAQFDYFVQVCEAAGPLSKKICEVAQKLDQEGF